MARSQPTIGVVLIFGTVASDVAVDGPARSQPGSGSTASEPTATATMTMKTMPERSEGSMVAVVRGLIARIKAHSSGKNGQTTGIIDRNPLAIRQGRYRRVKVGIGKRPAGAGLRVKVGI